ncbi:MAG TPA: DUF418 domain-containing protein [Pseudoxanthomonas sp.]
MSTPPLSPTMNPLPPAERMQVLDVLRGFALLGILLMNMEGMAGPLITSGTGLDPALTGADRWADALIYVFVQGKFFTLFSLLFGMGFAVMSQRAQDAQRPFAGLYWRRGLTLLAIGLVHALLIWSGDILVTYALLSMLLLAFREVSGRWLVWLAIASFLAPLGLMMALGLMGTLMQSTPELAAAWKEAMSGQDKMIAEMLEGQRQAFGSGSYWQATLQRAKDLGFSLMNLMVVGPLVFGMFLLGSWFVKSGAIAQPQTRPRLFCALRWLALPAGLALVSISFAIDPTQHPDELSFTASTAFCLGMLGGALMCLGYAGWVVRGMQSPAGAGTLAWLAPAGRMALTNYLLQSLVCTLVFYGYGLGYFERLPRAWQIPFALALFGAQVLLSRWWLRHFRFGPMEWLWRSATYLKPQPMRIRA